MMRCISAISRSALNFQGIPIVLLGSKIKLLAIRNVRDYVKMCFVLNAALYFPRFFWEVCLSGVTGGGGPPQVTLSRG